ncbi:MAG: glycoside hydrolase [Dethiobacteria bacterium]
MKDVYVILAFHAHELLWDLPEILLSSLDERNPMKDTILDENYMQKRREEGRDIYSLSIKFGDSLNAPLCVEYSNELLHQIEDVVPHAFQKLKEGYARGRLHPLYGHAHHTHVSLLREKEITQEILWNMQFLHNYMQVPYPKYNGLFAPEASYSYHKMAGIKEANVDYVIFPHLSAMKAPFHLQGRGDYRYKPFRLKTNRGDLLAFPRNFPISQEIWRPITKMKRKDVKFQGYMLGEFPVFGNEYLYHEREEFPIDMEAGVELYKKVLREELEKAPPGGVLVYIQDLELMDFGDLALIIMEQAWKEVLRETRENLRIYFVTPDEYIDDTLQGGKIEELPVVEFGEMTWAPEIRLILRVDGHYPPLGVTGVGRYDLEKTGLYRHPHIFWENGKYFCGIFDTLADNFNISLEIPAHGERLNATGYDLPQENPDNQAVLYLRIMKRACNWGWRPTEGRQKLPCLKGYLFCTALLQKMAEHPEELIFNHHLKKIEERNIAGIVRTLEVFIDGRINYLQYGMEQYAAEKGEDLAAQYQEIGEALKWKELAVGKAVELYDVNKSNLDWPEKMEKILLALRDYCQAVFMSTEHIQRIWGKIPDTEFMVEKMYKYLYEIYPPLFPSMLDELDSLGPQEIEDFFAALKKDSPVAVEQHKPLVT